MTESQGQAVPSSRRRSPLIRARTRVLYLQQTGRGLVIITIRHFVFAEHCAALEGPKTLLQSVAGLTGCSLLLKSWHV